MKKIELKPGIFWVGAVDFNLRNFHHYSRSPKGSTYNAYVVLDEKNVLFDTVSGGYADELLKQISNIVEPEKIDYIVCHHLEKDHSGCLPRIVEMCKPEKIFCSVLGEKSLRAQFDADDWPVVVVKDGERLNIGKRNITFLETRMVHWPDSMVSYLEEDRVLFSNDAFGQNVATSFRYADEYDRSMLLEAMQDYYYNIVLPFSPQVLKILDRIAQLGLKFDVIAPDHGLMYRTPEDVAFVLDCYREFAEQKPAARAVIAFEGMWGATQRLAYAIGDGLLEEDVNYTIVNLQQEHYSRMTKALATAGALIVGSATRNNMPMPFMMAAMANAKGLKPKNLVGATFGSYGWSGEAPKMLAEALVDMKVEVIGEPVRAYFKPTEDDLAQCRALGREVAKALKERL